jgi:hypothetical protein
MKSAKRMAVQNAPWASSVVGYFDSAAPRASARSHMRR